MKQVTAIALLLAVGLLGCHRRVEKTPPETYPVSGKLVTTRGQLPPAGSTIQFQPENVNWTANGRIEADGSFTLSVPFNQKRLPGATQGPHSVTVFPIFEHRRGNPISIQERCVVEPKDNRFTVSLD